MGKFVTVSKDRESYELDAAEITAFVKTAIDNPDYRLSVYHNRQDKIVVEYEHNEYAGGFVLYYNAASFDQAQLVADAYSELLVKIEMIWNQEYPRVDAVRRQIIAEIQRKLTADD